MKNLMLVLALIVGLAPLAFAAGPSIEPGPETPLQASAELLQILSDARVAKQMHTAASRYGVQLREVTVRRLSTELAEYTLKFSSNRRPTTYANFTVHAGGGFTGIFSVVSVGELNVAQPVIEPLPFGRP